MCDYTMLRPTFENLNCPCPTFKMSSLLLLCGWALGNRVLILFRVAGYQGLQLKEMSEKTFRRSAFNVSRPQNVLHEMHLTNRKSFPNTLLWTATVAECNKNEFRCCVIHPTIAMKTLLAKTNFGHWLREHWMKHFLWTFCRKNQRAWRSWTKAILRTSSIRKLILIFWHCRRWADYWQMVMKSATCT